MHIALKISRIFFVLTLFFASTLFASSASKETRTSELSEEKSFSHPLQITARSSCGCADEISDTHLPIQLPSCPCKQPSYVQNALTYAITPHDQNAPFINAFVTIMFSLKERIEEKKGGIGIDSHNKNMSKTHAMLKKTSNNSDKADIDLIHCLVCPLKSHLKYASFEDKEALASWLIPQEENVHKAFSLFGGTDALFDLSDDTDSVKMHASLIVEAYRQSLHTNETH